ncbi:uncharacterized protein BO66DRAFT_439798 [Aspergillus aculeatinus CBS 121060]|uniref:Uncharacterized protein n=1 Tax=Aspergillus aculeatinus CBS 121060 TaxID=1448322 RepID=A0ACD1H594_9EURO|nr:hypothetical protein BO66DRAFT_439798 [Aspergillus aculeatinus CBS 121060]RAH68787.1 hypothetical protein BO66DRAFT_439798 [Aspergillus aculeatinus CBS 121060]
MSTRPASDPGNGISHGTLTFGLLTPQLIVNIIRKNFPALQDRVPAGHPSQTLPPGVHPTGWDMTVSLDILSKGLPQGRWKYIDLETMSRIR